MSFTCPRCGRTSYHPKDEEEGYCGACHDWIDTEIAPPLVSGQLEEVLSQLGGDPIAIGMCIFLADICTKITADLGWDVPAELCSIERSFAPAELVPDGMIGVALASTPIGFNWDSFDGAEMAQMLRRLAKALSGGNRHLQKVLGSRDVVAWMLAHEGWTFRDSAATRAYSDADPEQRGSIAAHPLRAECRFLLVVDRAGYAYQAMQFRGEDSVRLMVDRGDGQIGGNLADALRELAGALPDQSDETPP